MVIDHALEADLDELWVVLGQDARTIRGAMASGYRNSVGFIESDEASASQGRSLAVGMAALGPEIDAVAILLGDQPLLEGRQIRAVVSAWQRDRPPILRPLYTQTRGEEEPGHPVVVSRALFSALQEVKGDEGVRAVIREHPEWLETLPLAGPSPQDIDTPADYARIRGQG